MNKMAKLLRMNGGRLTRPRQKVFGALTDRPQTVIEIISGLRKKGIKIDKVTVYRTLEWLAARGIVGKVRFKDGIAKYEMLDKGSHHHHLVCDNCGSVEDISFNEKNLLDRVSRRTRFQIKSHLLEFFGVCPDCQRGAV